MRTALEVRRHGRAIASVTGLLVAQAAIVLAACGGAGGAPAGRQDTELAVAMDRFVDRAVTDLAIMPGVAVAVVRDTQIVYERGFGYRDVERKLPVTAGTVFYIASTAKSFMGVLAAILEDEGWWRLDDPIAAHVPDLRLRTTLSEDELTLRRLLTHRSGVDQTGFTFRTAYSGQYTRADLIRVLGRSAAIDTSFVYSNLGSGLVGIAIGDVTGEDFRDVARQKLFAPLGMEHTSWHVSDGLYWEMAAPYATTSTGYERIPFLKEDATMAGAGGMLTTVRDLARWVEVHLNHGRLNDRQVIPEAVIRAAQRSWTPVDREFYEYHRHGYGLGLYHARYEGDLLLHHFGSFPGWRSHFSFMPEHGIGVVVLGNERRVGVFLPDLIANYAYDLLLNKGGLEAKYDSAFAELRAGADRILAEDDREADPAARHPITAADAARFTGSYASEMLGTITVWLLGDTLRAATGRLTSPLLPTGEDATFLAEFLPHQEDEVRFFGGSTGRVDSLSALGGVWHRVPLEARRANRPERDR